METSFEIIEKYIDGDLEGQELKEFENLLATNFDVKRDYHLSLKINKSIEEEDVMALRKTMDLIFEESKIRRLPNVIKKRKLYYAVAASIAILFAAASFMQWFGGGNLSNSDIYNKYYTPYEVSVTYRSGNEKVDKLLLHAMEKYEEQDYRVAIGLFEEVLKYRGGDMAVSLYAGVSYMEEGRYNEANRVFNKVIVNNDNLFVEQAKWFSAMCCVKTDESKKAKVLLNELIEGGSIYKAKAQDVLSDLQ